MDLSEAEIQELDFLHWMVFGTRVGVVADGEPLLFGTVETRTPRVFNATETVSRLIRQAVRLAGRLTPGAARGLPWLVKRRAPGFTQVFHEVVATAEDLLVFTTVYSGAHKHFNRMTKEHVAQWIELRLDDEGAVAHRAYHPRHRYSMADLVRLTHPTFRGIPVPTVDWLLGRGGPAGRPLLAAVDVLRNPSSPRKWRLRVLRENRVPSPLAEMAVGQDPDLWLAALPSLSGEAILAALPRQCILSKDFTGQNLALLVNRLTELAPLNAPRLLRAAWKIPRLSSTKDLREALGKLLVGAAQGVTRPPGRTIVLIDRPASCPPGFFREALAAASFGPTRLYLVDDVVQEGRLARPGYTAQAHQAPQRQREGQVLDVVLGGS